MDLNQWEYEFDILYNNVNSNQAPELNSLEKSIILTEAQEDVFLSLYSGTTSTTGFEGSEEITEYLRTHVKEKSYSLVSSGKSDGYYYFEQSIDDEIWFPVLEKVVFAGEADCDNTQVAVTPVTHDELVKVLSNPFKKPTKRKVLRLIRDNKFILYAHIGSLTYKVDYLKKLNPIILPSIHIYMNGGESKETCDYPAFWVSGDTGQNCELPEFLHRRILLRAIQIAKAAWA